MYVCLRCLSMYVCLQACMHVWDRKSSSWGWVRFLTESAQYWMFYSFLLEICEGEYFWRPQTYIRSTQACMYVCMFETAKRVCMYVCMYEFCEHICMSEASKHVCMYVSKHACMPQTYIHTCLSKTNHKCYQPSTNKHACMFENRVFCRENQTYTLKHTSSKSHVLKNKNMGYVWACMFHFPWQNTRFSNIHAQTYMLTNPRWCLKMNDVINDILIWYIKNNKYIDQISIKFHADVRAEGIR